jgi:hypothetical protein
MIDDGGPKKRKHGKHVSINEDASIETLPHENNTFDIGSFGGFFDINKLSYAQIYTMGAVLLIILSFLTIARLMPTSKKQEALDDVGLEQIEVKPLPELVTIADFSDYQLRAMVSGREDYSLFALKDKNKAMIEHSGFACATTWLQHLLENLTHSAVYYNVLTLRHANGTYESFVNVVITQRSRETVMVETPLRYRSTRAVRTYALSLSFDHAHGSYETESREHAFCIQELYMT